MLRDCLNDATVPLAIRRQIPKVLARIPSSDSADALADSLIQSDPEMRFDVLKALNKLRARDPGLVPPRSDVEDLLNVELLGYYRSFQILAAIDPNASTAPPGLSGRGGESMLTRALRERMAYELERIFRLLALLYPPRDVHNDFLGLTLGTPQRQANAQEVLEHLLQPDLYRPRVAAIAKEVDYQAREVLFTDNEAADSMFVLLEGEAVLLRPGHEGKKLEPGHVAGLLAFLAGDSQPESAVGTQPVRALWLDQEDFYDAMAEDFTLTRGILRALVRRATGTR